jgi:predicted metal-dependent hydrolase
MSEPEVSYTREEALNDCTGEIHPLAVRGLELFNQGEYFEAHEALELAWRDETGPVRDLYRGILQVGVAYYHIQRGNYTGARKMFQRAQRWLSPWPAECRGIQVETLRRDARLVEELVIALGPERLHQVDQSRFRTVTYSHA